MKILVIHSADNAPDKQSGVDLWRITRPMRELAEHVDWQIDYQPTFIKDIDLFKEQADFSEEELEKAAAHLGSYDAIFSSYFYNAASYTLLKVVKDRFGTQFVLDVDDHMFAINEDNPVWTKVNDREVWWVQCMIRDVDYLTTTTEELANEFRKRRADHQPDSVIVLPNAISDDFTHPDFNHGDETVIGFFGGASHWGDLNETPVLRAVEKLMHENKQVRFKAIGMVADHYLPRGRYELIDGVRGQQWTEVLFPKLELDIAIAPLLDNTFNATKSDIKWQEATRAGAAFVASNVGPYKRLPLGSAVIVENTTEAWYDALKALVDQPERRRKLVHNARVALAPKTLERNWGAYRLLFERVGRVKAKAH